MGDVVAVDHHRRDAVQCFLDARLVRVEFLDEGAARAGLERLDHLHDQLAAGRRARPGVGFRAGLEPGLRRMAAAGRLAAHVGRAAIARDAVLRDGRGVAVDVDLQRGADEHVDAVEARQLTHRAIGMEAAIASGEEHVGAGGGVAFHADFAAEGEDALDPARLDGRDHGRQRIDHPVLADLALEAKPLAVGRQQQLDGRRVEADTVVQRLDFVLLVDAAQRDHGHQHLDIGDRGRIAREQRLQVHGVGRFDDRDRPGRPECRCAAACRRSR